MSDRYNGLDLKRGSTHSEEVMRLQTDLNELGFRLVGEPDSGFGRRTMWAVREFQAYASMTQAAREVSSTEPVYADRLSTVHTGEHRYTGPVSGVVNESTRKALQHWLDSRWRCPVVIEAWKMKAGKRSAIHAENIWLHDEVTSTAPRMFARDLSGYFTPGAGNTGDDRTVIGDFVKFGKYSGPRSIPPAHTSADAELAPESLVGIPLAGLNARQRSTYRVVRAVSEVECMGFFDSVNCYDNAFVSVGPCHWTLGIVVDSSGNVAEGELCGFLAYLQAFDENAFQKVFGFFGAKVDESWIDANGEPTGATLFNAGARKYAGWVALQAENGFVRLAENEQEGNLFKTWHWFYRFVMAGRTVPGYRNRMWHMARIRLRDLLSLPRTGASDAPRLKDLFTSERAMAIILRWHVRFPAHIATGGKLGPRLQEALDMAREKGRDLDWNGSPAAWTDAHEEALLRALRSLAETAGGGLPETIQRVNQWPAWANGNNPFGYRLSRDIGPLHTGRQSFQFDDSDLPPALR